MKHTREDSAVIYCLIDSFLSLLFIALARRSGGRLLNGTSSQSQFLLQVEKNGDSSVDGSFVCFSSFQFSNFVALFIEYRKQCYIYSTSIE